MTLEPSFHFFQFIVCGFKSVIQTNLVVGPLIHAQNLCKIQNNDWFKVGGPKSVPLWVDCITREAKLLEIIFTNQNFVERKIELASNPSMVSYFLDLCRINYDFLKMNSSGH